MKSSRYSIAFVIVIVLSIVDGQRTKLKFRPKSEWFAAMQGSPNQSPSYDEQSDQPVLDNQNEQPVLDNQSDQPTLENQFQDLYVDDLEPESSPHYGANKFARHPSQEPAVFQSLCPTTRRDVDLKTDPDYQYRPEMYEEVRCSHPFGRNAHMHQRNKVCGLHGFSCIQIYRDIFISRRAYGTDCWEVETRRIPSACECMWPRHYKGDIVQHHH